MDVASAVAILSLAISGLCILLWNTNGSLDWLAPAIALAAGLLLTGISVWNDALGYASAVASSILPAGEASALSNALHAHQWPGELFLIGVPVCGGVAVLPFLIRAARSARREP